VFDVLSDRFTKLRRQLLGYGRLSDREVSQSLREVRTVLLEADVNYKVVGHFIRAVEARLKEKNVTASLKPGELINVTLFQELTQLLGGSSKRLLLDANPVVVSLVGLQGTGKTTFAGKLALKFKSRRPLLVACDCRYDIGKARRELGYRPVVGFNDGIAGLGRAWRAQQ